MTDKVLRCAIYTRKSSDEGLDQSFNSLDAQREAGEAYVLSQAHEGWTILPARYDDGGFSGGTMERPALQRLLADIASGDVDIVVVYKIDRLTRSLADFSRIIEVFEKAGASFVAVTQAFNTTNSMGRLMLNVLLSFAQFEREVTGERIRDKIAASKAKGMWVGGLPPLGYDLPAAGTRKLLVNESEANTVRYIFTRYLELGSAHGLQRELAERGILSKAWVTAAGKRKGGQPFSRGALFHLLRNRIYLGQIVHRAAVHEGEHDAILDPELFEQVQRSLEGNARRRVAAGERRMIKAPLTGKLFDAAGQAMSPTFSRGQSGRSYRYYVSASLQQGATNTERSGMQRISATALERILSEAITNWTAHSNTPLDHVRSVRIVERGLTVEITGARMDLALHLAPDERILGSTRSTTTMHIAIAWPLRGGNKQVPRRDPRAPCPDPALINALRHAHQMVERDQRRPVVTVSPVSPYDRKILRLAFLAPDLQRDILAGLQPRALNLEGLRKIEIPLAWSQQRKALGWPPID